MLSLTVSVLWFCAGRGRGGEGHSGQQSRPAEGAQVGVPPAVVAEEATAETSADPARPEHPRHPGERAVLRHEAAVASLRHAAPHQPGQGAANRREIVSLLLTASVT